MLLKHVGAIFVMAIVFSYLDELSYGYNEKTTHIKINGYAATQSNLDSTLRETYGFCDGMAQQFDNKTPNSIIKNGGEYEDATFPDDRPNYRYLRHFHDPYLDWGQSGLWGADSLIVWALKQTEDNSFSLNNLYSWPMARKSLYAALIGNNSEDEYGRVFRSLGQLLHLVSDAAVPAHVRNDAHPGLGLGYLITSLAGDMYEKWAAQNHDREEYGIVNYAGKAVDPAIFSKADLSQEPSNPVSALWDQNIYLGSNPLDTWTADVGLAEFTNANFLSQDKLLGPYAYPELQPIDIDMESLSQIIAENGEIGYVYYYYHPDQHYRLATLTFMSSYAYSECYDVLCFNYDLSALISVLGQDDAVWKDYADLLLPRAVGYSAALLDYFFRGTLEISAPDGVLYSIIDGGNSPQEFTRIKAKVKNTTPGEEISAGSLVAVVRYKQRIDYREDLSTDPPPASSREADFSLSASAPIPIESLSAVQGEEFTFDFSDNPIPVDITDLFLQVVFKGTLGNEKDIAVAVGMKDLNEPSHHVVWNSTDQLVFRDTLFTAQEVRTHFSGLADDDDDGIFNEVDEGEPYIDPYAVTMKLTFTRENPETTQEPLVVAATASELPPGRYSRLIILADIPADEHAWLTASTHRSWDQTDVFTDEYYSFHGVIAQESLDVPWTATPLTPDDYLHRGVRQHYLLTEYYCLSTLWSCGYVGELRPVPVNLSPYPVLIHFE